MTQAPLILQVILQDIIAPDGSKRRVLAPADGSVDAASEGIPVSLDIGELYPHMPPAFVAALIEALWARGLVEPADFLKAGAAEKARSALLDVVKLDALDMIALAKKELEHNG